MFSLLLKALTFYYYYMAQLYREKQVYSILEIKKKWSLIFYPLVPGPACDDLCAPAGLLAAKLNTPVISYSCASTKLNSRARYPTFARTSVVYADIGNVLVDLLTHFRWTRVALIVGHEDVWRETASFYEVGIECCFYSTVFYHYYHSTKCLGYVQNPFGL